MALFQGRLNPVMTPQARKVAGLSRQGVSRVDWIILLNGTISGPFPHVRITIKIHIVSTRNVRITKICPNPSQERMSPPPPPPPPGGGGGGWAQILIHSPSVNLHI